MRWSSALAAAALLILPAVAHAADPAPVIAAEHAFAARAAQVGVPRSFLDFMADDARVFAPEPKSAKAHYTARLPGKSPAEGGPLLVWWPTFAGLAASGDLGFTTGPAEVGGKRYAHYFTVWKRQPDGAWKWVYDGGVDSDPSRAPGPDAAVRQLPPGAARPISSTAALAQVQRAEARLAAQSRRDVAQAYRAVLAADAQVQGSKLAPAATPAAVVQELAQRPASIVFTARGGEASRAGDLAWTWGEATWSGGHGHYVRVWQRRAQGWRLVFDQLKPVEPA